MAKKPSMCNIMKLPSTLGGKLPTKSVICLNNSHQGALDGRD